MKLLKMFLGLAMLIMVLLAAAPQALAGGAGPEPPANAIIGPTEVWGEVVLFCGPSPPNSVSVRVKRVVDCNVETQAMVEPNWAFGCSDDPNAPLRWALPATVTFFDIPGTPFVSKVKNWKRTVQPDGNVYSFDAQFKFFTTP